ncbi:proteasome assembly chaperone family protein [Microbacterium dextranolyticum]|uniref:PAC2 family protein n=1 Tax=Microbacterium dextranolyticum TaxID=36806 RepID=A0A9W6M5U5_9MICO|nr:PAC2 family protein [Microbacterium dextranolyticum]MBM7463105.1 hypothetical protein [Microbacterium dextranolyticum]GLJ95789.1 hypothetical protein GCM10017591_18520 [Microbacterium dextranolyticum]
MDELGRRVLVVAFDGWNDAGEAASAAVSHIRESGAYREAFGVDPELYFDYQYTRPQVRLEADGSRRLVWPDATLWRPLHPAPAVGVGDDTTEGTRLWLLSGFEPARAWQAFVAELIDAALREDITGIVALGSMMSDVPHTRPISVFAGSENDALRAALDLEKPTYEGPAGILTVLATAAEAAGIPCAALWASVPHYVAGHTPSPKATLALLDRLTELTGAVVPRGELPAESLAWEASIDAAASDDEEMTDYIHQLEQTRDTWDSPEASGDAIAQEFERYLRRGGDGPRGFGHGPGPGSEGPRRS